MLVGDEPAAVGRVTGARPDVDEGGVLDDVGPLEARQLDDLLDEPGQAVGLDADPPGEAGDRLGVVVRVEHGLGEQRDAADRGLELVADVGEEVPPDLLDACRLGPVLDEEEHVVGAEGGDAGGDDEAPVPEALLQGQLGLADDPVATHGAGQVEQLRVHELLATHEPLRDGGG